MTKQFKVAMLADIHGNSHALKAVLADIEQQSPDIVVFGGDFASKGPNPAECVDLAQQSGYPAIIGNTDLDILNKNGAEEKWMREQLGKVRLDYLQSLPMQKRIRPPNSNDHLNDLLIVHSTPRSCYDLLILEPEPENEAPIFAKPTPAGEAIRMMADAKANLIVYGHIHRISKGIINEQRVESIGAVGFPFDQDHRAAYAIAEWDDENREWRLEHRRVGYEFEKTIADMEQSTHPYPDRSIRMLRDAQWYRGKPRVTRPAA